ncbi:MAG: hypothetical protein K8T20_19415 [Planctomycetes bacterium]|nr:hypothetical protein [Planctomycetota bacterium]
MALENPIDVGPWRGDSCPHCGAPRDKVRYRASQTFHLIECAACKARGAELAYSLAETRFRKNLDEIQPTPVRPPLPNPGPELDSLVVKEIFGGNAPIPEFKPSTDKDHAARIIPRLEQLGFEVSTKGLVINGIVRPSLNPREFHFSAHKRGDFTLAMRTCGTLDDWCAIVCGTSIDVIRSDKGV